MFVSKPLLEAAIEELHSWSRSVPKQNGRHVWSLLPIKLRGAKPGEVISYKEDDDKQFLDRFFKLHAGMHPYFDPFTRTWLPAGYWHSNAATFRKKTFMRSWGACVWQDDRLRLVEGYHQTFEDRVLSKAGRVFRIPALAATIWFYKRPSLEWPDRQDLRNGLPARPDEAVRQFRRDFSFDDRDEWTTIFDPSPGELGERFEEVADA